MPKIPGLRTVFRLPWRTDAQVARDVDDELAFHLDMCAEELVAAGLTPDEARREARRQFGDVERTRRYCRESDRRHAGAERRAELLADTAQDVRYALRQLRKGRGFTAVAVLTLALGIGATTTIFSVVHGVLLRPLPYPEPDRLVRLFQFRKGGRETFSPANFVDVRAQSRSFAGVAALAATTVNLTRTGAEPERVEATQVTADFFSLLGVRPRVGRTFAPGEDAWGGPKVAVVSEALWRRALGGDRSAVGRPIAIDGEPYTLLGVIPEGVGFPAEADLWLPLAFEPAQLADSRGAQYLRVVARLRAGVPLERASAELATIAARLEAQYPEKNTGVGVVVMPMREVMVGEVRRPLTVLLAAVGLVLLIACANVGNLMLVRAAGRRGEFAVRTALGASRGRLVRQLLTESVLTSFAGGAAGVAVALVATRAFVRFAPEGVPRLGDVRVDGAVLAFTVAVTVGAGVLFGLVPALRGPVDLHGALRAGARGRLGGRRVGGPLVVSETALAIVLLVGAGLMLRSFAKLRAVDPGFHPTGVVTLSLTLPEAAYPDPSRQRAFTTALVERLESMPGTRSAAAVFGLPLTGFRYSLSFDVAGRAPLPPGDGPSTQIRVVTPDYFATLGVPVTRGRAFSAADHAGAPPVVVVNAEAVRRFFPNEDPIGQRVALGWTRDSVRMGGEIVGVVGDVRAYGLDADAMPEMYVPYDQWPVDWLSLVVRTTADPGSAAAAARAHVRALDPNLPVVRLTTMERVVSESVATPRFYAMLLGSFAVSALLLAAVGLYGVVSYAVSQRTHEIGLRLALGAPRARVLRTVIGQGLLLTLVGAGAGAVASLWAGQALGTLLYEVRTTDPLTFAAVTLLLAAVATAACWVPARRATRVDPLVAMRGE